jgi:hypothetical protein
MQLRKARLCLDCEELHDQKQCPICASEAFAFLTQWMPAPERRKKPRPATLGGERSRPRAAVDERRAVDVMSTIVRWSKRARRQLEAARLRETGELQ